MGSALTFGELLKQFRLKAGFGLRSFAGLLEIPASNLSAIEHGRRAMPKDKLESTAEILGLERQSPEWKQFFDAAPTESDLPADVEQIAGRKFIPALLRTIDNVQLTDADIKKLIADIETKHGQGG